MHIGCDFFYGPVPPLYIQQLPDPVIIKSLADLRRRVAANDGIGGYIFGDGRIGRDDRAITDRDTSHDSGIVPYPHIIADDGIPLRRILLTLHRPFPPVTEDRKGIGRYRIGQMVGPVHDKGDPRSNHAKLSDDQLVTGKVEMIPYILFKVADIFKVIIVGVIPDDDIGPRDDVLKETQAIIMRQGIDGVFVRTGKHGFMS